MRRPLWRSGPVNWPVFVIVLAGVALCVFLKFWEDQTARRYWYDSILFHRIPRHLGDAALYWCWAWFGLHLGRFATGQFSASPRLTRLIWILPLALGATASALKLVDAFCISGGLAFSSDYFWFDFLALSHPFLLCVIMAGFLAYWPPLIERLMKRDVEVRAGLICRKCGYSLRGNVSGICPECGTPIAKARVDTDSPREEH